MLSALCRGVHNLAGRLHHVCVIPGPVNCSFGPGAVRLPGLGVCVFVGLGPVNQSSCARCSLWARA